MSILKLQGNVLNPVASYLFSQSVSVGQGKCPTWRKCAWRIYQIIINETARCSSFFWNSVTEHCYCSVCFSLGLLEWFPHRSLLHYACCSHTISFCNNKKCLYVQYPKQFICCMHNEVGTCAEILPGFLPTLYRWIKPQSAVLSCDASPYPHHGISGARGILSLLSKETTVCNMCLFVEYSQLPDPSKVSRYLEPFVLGTIVFPEEYMGKMLSLCEVGLF